MEGVVWAKQRCVWGSVRLAHLVDSRMVRAEAGEMAGVISCAMLWGLVFFGRLCEPLQNFKFLPFIGCATLASALSS